MTDYDIHCSFDLHLKYQNKCMFTFEISSMYKIFVLQRTFLQQTCHFNPSQMFIPWEKKMKENKDHGIYESNDDEDINDVHVNVFLRERFLQKYETNCLDQVSIFCLSALLDFISIRETC